MQAGKFLNKLGKRIQANMKESEQRGGADGAPEGKSPRAGGHTVKSERFGSMKTMVAAADGSIWVAYKKGLLEKYSEGGQLMWSCANFKPGICSLAAVGGTIWVGGLDGQIRVVDCTNPKVAQGWKAHVFPVSSISNGGCIIYSLGRDGSIRGWSPSPPLPAVLDAWHRGIAQTLQSRELRVLAATWNVNEGRPNRGSLMSWLGERSVNTQLVFVGLQVGKPEHKGRSITALQMKWDICIGSNIA